MNPTGAPAMQSTDPTVPADRSNPTVPPSAQDDDEISLLDLALTMAENLRLLVLGPLAAGLLALGISFAITPTFTAKTQFLPPQQQQSSASALIQSLGSMGGLAAAATGLKNPADQYIAFMKSQSVLDGVVEQFKLQERYEAKFKVDARKRLQDNTKLSAGKDGLIQLEVDDSDPQFAADLANGYIDELRKLMSRLSLTEAQQRRRFFEQKVQEARLDLAKADKALRATGINASTLKSSPLAAVEVVAKLKGAITSQEIKIGTLRGYLTEQAPEIKQALVELSALRSQLAKAELDEPAATGRLEDTYVERYREYKYSETLYEMFAKQYELARVDEAREGAVIQVVDPAAAPERKSKPKKAQVAMLSTLAAFVVLVPFVLIRRAVRNAGLDRDTAQKLEALRTALQRALGR